MTNSYPDYSASRMILSAINDEEIEKINTKSVSYMILFGNIVQMIVKNRSGYLIRKPEIS